MSFGQTWLLCVAVVGCAAATPVPRGTELEGHGSRPSVGARSALPDAESVRLGPPSTRGLGLRRVDRAARATTRVALDRY